MFTNVKRSSIILDLLKHILSHTSRYSKLGITETKHNFLIFRNYQSIFFKVKFTIDTSEIT